MKHTPTDEQSAVISAVAGKDSVLARAYAGCAKSSTLEMSAGGIRVPALILAFNKKIAGDMKGKFPGNFKISTMNGLGHGAWARTVPAGLVLDDRKLGKLVSEVAEEWGRKLGEDTWGNARRLVSGAMQAGIVPEGLGPEGFLPDNLASWYDGVGDGLGLGEDEFDEVWDLAREVLRRDIVLARAGTISFDDQVYCPTLLGGQFPKFPVTLVDEAQDLSPLNHRMVELSTRPDGRLIVVGDEKQAIYAFRGASGESIARLRGLRNSWVELPLATTFRCPKRVVERQVSHAPGFRAWHTNADGEVVTVRRPDGDEEESWEGWGWKDLEGLRQGIGATIAVLCRNNAPLMGLAMKLLRQRVGVVMLGTDIGRTLVGLSKKIIPEDGTGREAGEGLVDEWERGETEMLRLNGREERIAGVVDRAECLRAVLAGVRDAGELRTVIRQMFSRETGQVTLSSIHRAKGAEWDVVLHLDPWRVPSRWAKLAAADGDGVPLEQEWNLKYVCETRTKHTLVMADLRDFR